MKETEFLHKKFPDLNASRDVQAAALRAKRKTGIEPKPSRSQPGARIEEYLHQLAAFKEALPDGMEPKSREQREALKKKILDGNTTRYSDIPESYWKSYEQNIIRATGQLGDWQGMNQERQEAWKKKYVEPLLFDQRASLEEWFDYFLSHLSDDIPDTLKYWAFRSITQLQEYEKEEGQTRITFPRRSKGSVKKFPDLNPEALRYVVDALNKKFKGNPHTFENDIQADDRAAFEKFLASEKFADLYAWAFEHFNPIPAELLPITAGEWRVYKQGSDFEAVAQTLRGRGTGLCIAGRGAAQNYLSTGDLVIYYSNDEQGNPVFPRAAIHVAGNKIVEVRGIAYKQNTDSYINDTVQAKLNEFPDGKAYQKKTDNMKALTALEKKMSNGIELSTDDLIFLYERDSVIEGFGMNDDPRIKELRSKRNPKEDAPRVFECAPDQIAWGQKEFLKNPTHFKAYVGPLFDGIFTFANLEHIYTSFPERKIHRVDELREVAEKDIKNGSEYIRDIQKGGMGVYEYLLTQGTVVYGENKDKTFDKRMRERREEIKKRGGSETLNLIRLTVDDLFGDGQNHTTEQIWNKAKELGLELCPPETGPLLRLAIGKDQPKNTYWSIAMEQITDSGGYPDVFFLCHGVVGVLLSFWAGPGHEWLPGSMIVFRLRK
jgi:hypothetical protein